MDADGLKGNESLGIEGNNHDATSNEGTNVMNNCTEGSSSFSAPVDDEMKQQDSAQLEIDDADANSKAPSPQHSANATTLQPESSSAKQEGPGFYIERASDLFIVVSLCAEATKRKICDLAYSAMDELSKVAVAGKPLWKPLKGLKFEIMDNIEYLKHHCEAEETLREVVKMAEVGESQPLPSYDSLPIEYAPTPKPTPREHVKVEGSRDVECIKMNAINLVQLLMDVKQWWKTFFNIVQRAAFLGILTNGLHGGYNGRLEVISAEFQLPTPLVATWDCNFARYCKKLSPDMWAVVDVPLHKVLHCPTNEFRRRPSGCLIEEMSNGYSKVTWVEHVVADCSKLNAQFQPLMFSGLAFGATHWLASLVRSIECSETLKAENIPTVHGTMIPQEGRAGLLNLAGRIMRTFCTDISASSSNQWTQVVSLDGSLDLRVMVKNIMQDFGRPQGATLIFATTISLPVSPNRLFNFFRDENSRSKWDMFTCAFPTRELAYVIQGNDPRNRVSILQVNTGQDGRLGSFYVQESYTDSTGSSYVVYAPVQKFALSTLLNGGNPDNVAITPSGFAILPDGMSSGDYDNGGTGSILTIAYCIMQSVTNTTPLTIPPETVAAFNQFINDIVTGIKDAVLYSNF